MLHQKDGIMTHGSSGMGMSKHRTSGHSTNAKHFTGKRGSASSRSKGSTHKQRHLKRGTHVNKYK